MPELGDLWREDFSDEFVFECRMTLDQDSFNFWFISTEVHTTIGYVDASLLGYRGEGTLDVDGRCYLLVYDTEGDLYVCPYSKLASDLTPSDLEKLKRGETVV